MPGAPVVPAGQPREPRRYFHAVAVDFDGTLALDGRVEADTRGAIDEARDKGVRVVVVTGRILDELRGVVEDLEDFSDAVVAENGCVVWMPGRNWSAAKPIDGRLGEALTSAHINFRRGEVILACSGEDEPQVLAEVRSLGLDCQLVRNRSELMVLPAGVTKATGLLEVLTELGVSPHNTIAIGDAENDAPMLESCELAVAVANAIDALKARADIVLPEPNGLGVASFLRGPILAAPEAPSSARLELTLGVDEDGAAVRLPASRLNVAILGASGEGKSYVAGLVAEQLVGLRYSLLVIDPEGDFLGLADLPGVVMIEGAHSLPSPEVALRPFAHSDLSIVIDLTGIDASRRDAYVAGLRHQVSDLRARTGRPHWVVVDEAQDALGIEESPSGWGLSAGETGHCLVTWKSEVLPLTVVGAIDAVVLVGREPAPAAVHFAAQATGHPETELEERFPLRPGHALLARRAADAPLTTLSIAARRTSHSRHEHKYARQGVGSDRRFHFRRDDQTLTGVEAGNLEDLQHEVGSCEPTSLSHHLVRGDLSRWIAEVIRDQPLARSVSEIEARARLHGLHYADTVARLALGEILQRRRFGAFGDGGANPLDASSR